MQHLRDNIKRICPKAHKDKVINDIEYLEES